MNKFCPSCGTALEEGQQFCGTCGKPAQANAPDKGTFTNKVLVMLAAMLMVCVKVGAMGAPAGAEGGGGVAAGILSFIPFLLILLIAFFIVCAIRKKRGGSAGKRRKR